MKKSLYDYEFDSNRKNSPEIISHVFIVIIWWLRKK